MTHGPIATRFVRGRDVQPLRPSQAEPLRSLVADKSKLPPARQPRVWCANRSRCGPTYQGRHNGDPPRQWMRDQIDPGCNVVLRFRQPRLDRRRRFSGNLCMRHGCVKRGWGNFCKGTVVAPSWRQRNKSVGRVSLKVASQCHRAE